MTQQFITYDVFGRALAGPRMPPEERQGQALVLKNLRIDEKLNGAYIREGSYTLQNSEAPGPCYALGYISTESQGQSNIPLNFDLLYQTGSILSRYDISGDVRVALTAHANSIRTLTFEQQSTGTVLTGLGLRSYLFAGTPSVIIPGDDTYYSLGTPAPTADASTLGTPPPDANPVYVAPVTFSTTEPDTANGGYLYGLTYVNNITGYESEMVTAISRATISGGLFRQVNFAPEPGKGADYTCRVWRTTDGGSVFYLEAELSGQTTIFNNNGGFTFVPDTALSLNEIGALPGTRTLPPANATIAALHNSRIFIADGNTIYVSEPYNGIEANLGYFPVDNLLLIDSPVTAMYSWNNELLIFSSGRSFIIRGTSPDEYRLQPAFRVGCLNNNAITANGQDVTFVSEEGIHSLSQRNANISRPVDHLVQPLLYTDNSRQVVSSVVWNPYTKQFIYGITNDQATPVMWQDADTAADVIWQDEITGNDVVWQDPDNLLGNAQGVIVAYNPYLGPTVWTQYEFAQITSESYPFLMTQPHASEELGSIQQRFTYLSVYNPGTTNTTIIKMFAERGEDDTSPIEAELLLGPIVPGRPGLPKFVHSLVLETDARDPSYRDPESLGYLVDSTNPLDDPNWRDNLEYIPQNATRSRKVLPRNTLKWMHLYLKDNSRIYKKLVLRNFKLFTKDKRYRVNR